MANIRFKSYDQHQQSFFPLRLDEKIPESHPPRLINRFRSKRMKEQVNSLFIQVVMLLVEMGQISLTRGRKRTGRVNSSLIRPVLMRSRVKRGNGGHASSPSIPHLE